MPFSCLTSSLPPHPQRRADSAHPLKGGFEYETGRNFGTNRESCNKKMHLVPKSPKQSPIWVPFARWRRRHVRGKKSGRRWQMLQKPNSISYAAPFCAVRAKPLSLWKQRGYTRPLAASARCRQHAHRITSFSSGTGLFVPITGVPWHIFILTRCRPRPRLLSGCGDVGAAMLPTRCTNGVRAAAATIRWTA
jgi:hypothetical protein